VAVFDIVEWVSMPVPITHNIRERATVLGSGVTSIQSTVMHLEMVSTSLEIIAWVAGG
jgi:hypothetical protein